MPTNHTIVLSDTEQATLVAAAEMSRATPADYLLSCVREALAVRGREVFQADQQAIRNAIDDPQKVAAMKAALARR